MDCADVDCADAEVDVSSAATTMQVAEGPIESSGPEARRDHVRPRVLPRRAEQVFRVAARVPRVDGQARIRVLPLRTLANPSACSRPIRVRRTAHSGRRTGGR